MTTYIFDINKKLVGTADALAHTQKLVLNGQITADLSIQYDPRVEGAHYFGARDPDNPNEFWLYYTVNRRKENGILRLTGVHSFFHDLQGEVVRDVRPLNTLPNDALSRILEETSADASSWKLGISTGTKVTGATYYYQSRLSAFYDFLERWQVEFRPRMTWANGAITGQYIDIYDRLSGDYGKRYEYGSRLLTVTSEEQSDQIFTALIGMGKGEQVGDGYGRKITFEEEEWSMAGGDPVDKPQGQDYVALPGAVAQYGFRLGIIDFSEIEDPAALLQATWDALQTQARPKVQFSATALAIGPVELGETVGIVRGDLGIRYKTRVFEVERNFLQPDTKTFRLGDQTAATTAERVKAVEKETAIREQTVTVQLQNLMASMSALYWGEDGYTYDLKIGNEWELPAGIYSFDAPIDEAPTKMVYLGAGKLAVANSKDATGAWAMTTILDGDGLGTGIVGAAQILAGSITTDMIWVGAGATATTATDKFSAVDTALSDATALGQQAIDDLNADKNERQTYIQMVPGRIEIGEVNSEFIMRLTSNKLAFVQGTNEVAYFSANKLYITDAVVNVSLQIGNFSFTPRSNGNLSFNRVYQGK